MSVPHLPPELLDYIIDHLCGDQKVLQNCCLVSKSWIPRTRRYLFADILFRTRTPLELWKKKFPDPSTSPARYAKTLSIACTHVVTATDAEAGGWIRGFTRVVHLEVGCRSMFGSPSAGSLISFHTLSPILKSLHVHLPVLPPTQVFDLALSFPLLEDLAVTGISVNDGDGSSPLPTTVQPSSPPMFTGSLELTTAGIKPISGRLLSLPGGIHFRKLIIKWSKVEDILLTMALVDGCSHTLESFDITYVSHRTFIRVWTYVDNLVLSLGKLGSTLFNLSKATKLRGAVFRPGSLSVEWIITILQTITPEHQDLRHVSIYLPRHLPSTYAGVHIRRSVGEEIYWQWLDLDHLLVKFWGSHLIRPKVEQNTRYYIERLLPLVTSLGVIELVE